LLELVVRKEDAAPLLLEHRPQLGVRDVNRLFLERRLLCRLHGLGRLLSRRNRGNRCDTEEGKNDHTAKQRAERHSEIPGEESNWQRVLGATGSRVDEQPCFLKDLTSTCPPVPSRERHLF